MNLAQTLLKKKMMRKQENDSAKKEDAKVPESKLAKYIKTQQKSSNKTLEFDEDYKA